MLLEVGAMAKKTKNIALVQVTLISVLFIGGAILLNMVLVLHLVSQSNEIMLGSTMLH